MTIFSSNYQTDFYAQRQQAYWYETDQQYKVAKAEQKFIDFCQSLQGIDEQHMQLLLQRGIIDAFALGNAARQNSY